MIAEKASNTPSVASVVATDAEVYDRRTYICMRDYSNEPFTVGAPPARLAVNDGSDDNGSDSTMTKLTLYEEAMCCSTGVCGPDPDEELVEVSAALDQLEDAFDDLEVSRANIQHDIDQFLETQRIYDRVQEDGPSILPITVVDDEVVAEGEYLSYDELTAAIGETATAQEA